MKAYYNENDPKAATWLRELIRNGYIANGDVDERSIEDILPNDLAGYTQCHFFAGIGGWSYALRLAGWPDDRAVWTGSCPCQSFSTAGKGGGFADERHLWPAFLHLIRECRPERIFGEQVANALPWIDLISGDLEAEEYAVGAAIVGAHSVGAPHIRQRLYWVADSTRKRRTREYLLLREENYGRLAAPAIPETAGRGAVGRLALTESQQSYRRRGSRQGRGEPTDGGAVGGLEQSASEQVGLSRCAWFDGRPADWIECRDGKWRPVEPGTFPLAHGIPGRVGLLRGYGNAIVPQDAEVFIRACA